MSLEPKTRLGRYEIRSPLGQGGMGEVYLAQDTSELDRKVAIKVLSAEVSSDPNRMQRFIQEARTVSALNHPNILTIYEFGQEGATQFIAMEYVEGVTLRDYLTQTESRARRDTPVAVHLMRLRDVLEIAIQVAAALDAAHEVKVIHRDIKPENIMIRRRDVIVKVLDFGLAKPSEKPVCNQTGTTAPMLTQPGAVVGTVSYMSPEQTLESGEVDTRSDIWSLGVVLYEIITGRVPFEGKDAPEKIVAIRHGDQLPLSTYAAGVPERLEEIIAKMLAKNPNERYQTAKGLLIDLRSLCNRGKANATIERLDQPKVRSSSGGNQAVSAVRPHSGSEKAGGRYARANRKKLPQYLAIVGLLVLVLVALLMWRRYATVPPLTDSAPIDSIAVVPFQNKSVEPETDYLSDGLTKELTYSLSQLANLKVSPKSVVVRYKGKDADPIKIGNELGVDSVLMGDITQRGDSLNITVELVDVRTKRLRWGKQYDRRVSELLATQREIASEITQELKMKLGGEGEKVMTKRYTADKEAYLLYQKGNFFFAKRKKADVLRGIDYFKEAIAQDKGFALAYVGLANSYNATLAYAYVAPEEALPQAKAAALKARELDPLLAEAHAALAYSYVVSDWNWPESEREFKRALELDPNNDEIHFRYGMVYLMTVGRTTEAISELKRALELEPLSLVNNSILATTYLYGGQKERALEQARYAYDLEPNFVLARWNLGYALIVNGKYDEAISRAKESLQGDPTSQFMLRIAGIAHAKSGRKTEAEEVLKRFKEIAKTDYVSSYYVASIYAALDDKSNAFAELERSLTKRDWDLHRLKVDPFMDSLRDDQRFNEFLKRLNLL